MLILFYSRILLRIVYECDRLGGTSTCGALMEKLSRDVLLEVFEFLDGESLKDVMLVCRK